MSSQTTTNKNEFAQENDLAQLIGEKEKSFIFQLRPGESFQSHMGVLPHDDIIGQKWGSRVKTHTNKVFTLLQPALDDLLRDIPRETQIMYPKDIGYVIMNMGVGPGKKIIEAGSGSGSLTTILAYLVGDQGHVFSYDNRNKNSLIAKSNLEKFGLDHRATFVTKDISAGFDHSGVDIVFLDIPETHLYIAQARDALIPGGFFGSLVPTTNQVSDLITALKKNNFSYIEVSEIMHRYYKPSATRLRPVDRMVAHTGFLIFARRVTSISETDEI